MMSAAKKSKNKKKDAAKEPGKKLNKKLAEKTAADETGKKLKNKVYLKKLAKLQEWVKFKGLRVCVVFEGRDGAGKGGTIKAITERVSPRTFRVVALTAPTEREKTQMNGSATCRICRQQERWSSSIAAGITGQGSSG
jgi:polyphosphate kinase